MATSITITADKTLASINEEFMAHFPNLRLQFYTETHASGEESSLWDTANMNLPLNQVGTFDHDETLSINGHLKTSTFEQHFQELFGLGVQVMYFKDGTWHQTRTSDEWTLSQQNTQSENNRAKA